MTFQPVTAITGNPYLTTQIISPTDVEVLFKCFQVCKEWKRIVTEKVLNSIKPLFEKIAKIPFTLNDGCKYAISLIVLNRIPLFTDENFTKQMEGPVRDLLEASYDHSLPYSFAVNKRFFYDISRLNIEKALSPVDIEAELKFAIDHEAPMDYIEFLVKKSPMLKVDAVKMAAQKGNLDLVRHLLKSCPISQEQSESVIASLWEKLLQICRYPSTHSVQNGRAALTTIPELFGEGFVSDSCRESALQMAAYCGDLRLTRALLKNGPISNSCRKSAVELAAYCGALELVQELLAHGFIPVKGRGAAVSAAIASVSTKMATEKDAVRIIQVLLENGPIPESIRVRELSTARWHNLNKIAHLLDGPKAQLTTAAMSL